MDARGAKRRDAWRMGIKESVAEMEGLFEGIERSMEGVEREHGALWRGTKLEEGIMREFGLVVCDGVQKEVNQGGDEQNAEFYGIWKEMLSTWGVPPTGDGSGDVQTMECSWRETLDGWSVSASKEDASEDVQNMEYSWVVV